MDIRAHNEKAWDGLTAKNDRWTIPVGRDEIEAARQGEWSIVLTPTKPVPRTWFPDLKGLEVCCLASGGGQQGPILAAAGASVTTTDNSGEQLKRDEGVAREFGLDLKTVRGDMRDLSDFADASFDLIFHPVSNVFVPDVRPVWREAFRVLRPGGSLLAGFMNPGIFMFDDAKLEDGVFEVRHKHPYSDLTSLTEEERQASIEAGNPLCFGHTLQDQIGGQTDVGFSIADFYEDFWEDRVESEYMPVSFATRAIKPT